MSPLFFITINNVKAIVQTSTNLPLLYLVKKVGVSKNRLHFLKSLIIQLNNNIRSLRWLRQMEKLHCTQALTRLTYDQKLTPKVYLQEDISNSPPGSTTPTQPPLSVSDPTLWFVGFRKYVREIGEFVREGALCQPCYKVKFSTTHFSDNLCVHTFVKQRLRHWLI